MCNQFVDTEMVDHSYVRICVYMTRSFKSVNVQLKKGVFMFFLEPIY